MSHSVSMITLMLLMVVVPAAYSGCVESHVDYYGSDQKKFLSIWDLPKCQALCRQYSICKYYTWWRTWRVCYLKSSDSGRKSRNNFFSGPKYCNVNGNWGAWQSYGACSKSCGSGTRRRTRSCNNPAPAHGGIYCRGRSYEDATCNRNTCPVHGSWGGWRGWGSSPCSKTCGQGTKRRYRYCNAPRPAYGGSSCSGISQQDKTCKEKECPVNGIWGGWHNFGKCSKSCGEGTKRRTRDCNNPSPAHGGSKCPGKNFEVAACKEKECAVHCGGHTAPSCSGCPQGNGHHWCNGDCSWCNGACQLKTQTCHRPVQVSCGGHTASSCSGCPQGHGANWCNGDCSWCNGACQLKTKACH